MVMMMHLEILLNAQVAKKMILLRVLNTTLTMMEMPPTIMTL